jgi:hypothetical protein
MFPVINKPIYESDKSKINWLQADDDVLVWDRGDVRYIYPLFILGYHHVVNDNVNATPVAITACLLSGSNAVYSRRIGFKTFDLDVLGPLYYGNLIMYDKQTNTHWLQLTGESLSGPMKGTRLQLAGLLRSEKWKKVSQQDTIKVLKPVKDISFYRSFAKKYTTNPLGMKSVIPFKSPDNRLSPYEMGTGMVNERGAYFYKGVQQTASVEKDEVVTRVYWYSWSAAFPTSSIR